MSMVNVSVRGAPCFVNPAFVACVRAARGGESGASTILTSSGAELASPFPPERLVEMLAVGAEGVLASLRDRAHTATA